MFIYHKHNIPRASADIMTPDGLFPHCINLICNPYHPCNITSPEQTRNTPTTDSGFIVQHPHINPGGKNKVRNCRKTSPPPKVLEVFLAFSPKLAPEANGSCGRICMWVNGFSDDGNHAARSQSAPDWIGDIPLYPIFVEAFLYPCLLSKGSAIDAYLYRVLLLTLLMNLY